MAEWTRTTKWQPASAGGGSSGFPVECKESGELGLAKPMYVHQEVLAYLLATELNLAVPEMRIETVEAKTVGISLSWGSTSLDITKFRRDYPTDFNSSGMAAARKRACGLLALHAWVANEDHKDDHVVAKPGSQPGTYELASIDWAFAFKPAPLKANISINGPPCLMDKAMGDWAVLSEAISRIESLPDEKIKELIYSIPAGVLPVTDKERIFAELVSRKVKLRPAFKAAGWSADTMPAGAK
jgi:hypothetical protein